MKQALLISSNKQIIEEFRSISELVNVHLVVSQEPTSEQLGNTHRIFVDHEVDLAQLDLRNLPNSSVENFETTLVLAGDATANSWQVASAIDAKHIVLIPESRQWLVDYIKSAPTRLGQVVSFAGVTGGAGSTSIALAFARSAAQTGRSVTLVDLDFSSVGLEIAAGCEKLAGLNWSTLQRDAAQADGDAIIAELPEIEGVRLLANDVLGTPQDFGLQERVIEQLNQHCDLVVIDFGRWKIETANNSLPINQKYLVVPNTIRACAVGKEIFRIVNEQNQKLIIREVPGSGLNPVMVAQTLDTPLAAVVPTDPRICELSEQGLALGANPLSKFNRPISTLVQQLFGDQNVLRVA